MESHTHLYLKNILLSVGLVVSGQEELKKRGLSEDENQKTTRRNGETKE